MSNMTESQLVVSALTVERFWGHVSKTGPDDCWPWLRALGRGYGRFRLPAVEGVRRQIESHRFAYELTYGKIPKVNDEGLRVILDHTCHDPADCAGGPECPHRACCNPSHMKLSTYVENNAPHRSKGGESARSRGQMAVAKAAQVVASRAKTHCKHGHEFTKENTYVSKNETRHCKECLRIRSREYQRQLNGYYEGRRG